MRDDHGREYIESDAAKRAKAFEHGIFVLEDMHKRKLNPATLREYFSEFENCSAEAAALAMRMAIHEEQFFPVPATFRKLIARAKAETGEREPVAQVVPEYVAPKFTPEERAEIEWMKKDLSHKFAAMPWAKELPQGEFMNLGRPER